MCFCKKWHFMGEGFGFYGFRTVSILRQRMAECLGRLSYIERTANHDWAAMIARAARSAFNPRLLPSSCDHVMIFL